MALSHGAGPRAGHLVRGDMAFVQNLQGIEQFVAEIVAAEKIPTIDLNAAVRGRPELHSDNVHFKSQGSQILAAEICAAIQKLLPQVQ